MDKLSVSIEPVVHGSPLPAWWRPLFDLAPNASAFLTPSWMAVWLSSYGDAFSGEWVSCWDQGRCVAGCLLLTRRGKVGPLSVRLAVINTAAENAEESPWIEYNDILCLPPYEDSVAEALTELLQAREWDQLYLNGFTETGVMSRLRYPVPGAVFESIVKPSPYVDFAGLSEGAESLLSSNSRAQVKRSIKLYGQRGPVGITAAESVEEARGFLAELTDLHRSGWKRRGKAGGLRTDQFIEFHRQLIARLWDEGAVVLLRASAGSEAIGYLYNFLHLGKVYFYQSGFSYEEDPKLKPGLVAHCLAIDFFRTRGMREYDFMAGASRYKASLANASRQLIWARVERPTPRMRIVRMARALKHSLMAARNPEEVAAQD